MGVVLRTGSVRGNAGSACVGKRKYGTEASALAGSRFSEDRMRRHCKKYARPINVYRCPFCRLWHLTKREA